MDLITGDCDIPADELDKERGSTYHNYRTIRGPALTYSKHADANDSLMAANQCGRPCALSGGRHFLCHGGSLAPSSRHRLAQSEYQEPWLCRQSVCEAAGCSACRKPGGHKGKHACCLNQDEDGHFTDKLNTWQDEGDVALRGKRVETCITYTILIML